ncbi:hypothetical protein K435DRAFT_865953 [Dendrothele bispora CBS 962.96]|uniref:Uncharacterized protein n=1 Tax=Dendrothele bispora (strain CBS 962.96) TaxID=1314807 RepID=A0A4S8LI86_DENBC|nr:hypothetical protein K435DRAFT_865953 [Dendrothele bispora CBS 962.96]
MNSADRRSIPVLASVDYAWTSRQLVEKQFNDYSSVLGLAYGLSALRQSPMGHSVLFVSLVWLTSIGVSASRTVSNAQLIDNHPLDRGGVTVSPWPRLVPRTDASAIRVDLVEEPSIFAEGELAVSSWDLEILSTRPYSLTVWLLQDKLLTPQGSRSYTNTSRGSCTWFSYSRFLLLPHQEMTSHSEVSLEQKSQLPIFEACRMSFGGSASDLLAKTLDKAW